MITKLEHANKFIANQIYTVFQRAYKIEAQLIGVDDFPPLMRGVNDIICSKTDFYGFSTNNCLAAIIEIEVTEKHLDIHSLTVDPKYFRKGIADKLIKYVLNSFDITAATVETAAVNRPAIHLYERNGFVEFKKWIPSHGIEKVAMSVQLAKT